VGLSPVTNTRIALTKKMQLCTLANTLLAFINMANLLTLPSVSYTLASLNKGKSPSSNSSSWLFSSEVVDLGNTYDFFTDERTALRFYIVIIAQYIFGTIGWFFSSSLWHLIRGEEISTDPNLSGLVNFVLSDQAAVGNIALGTGYAIFGSLAWIVLSQLGTPAPTKKRLDGSDGIYPLNVKIVDKNDISETKIDSIYDKQSNELDLISMLDDTLAVFPVLRVTVIQTVLSTAFILFWTVMRALPDRANKKRRKKRSTALLESNNDSFKDNMFGPNGQIQFNLNNDIDDLKFVF